LKNIASSPRITRRRRRKKVRIRSKKMIASLETGKTIPRRMIALATILRSQISWRL